MSILSREQIAKLRANSDLQGVFIARGETFDPVPVVKLFATNGAMTWLITEIDEDEDRMFGLCDLGMGEPELGYVMLSEITSVPSLMVEVDQYVKLDRSLSVYTDEARIKGRIET